MLLIYKDNSSGLFHSQWTAVRVKSSWTVWVNRLLPYDYKMRYSTCACYLWCTVWHTTVTSFRTPWRLKTPALRLFTQTFNQAQVTENIKAPRHWLCEGNSPLTAEFSAQRASNAENVSIWLRHLEWELSKGTQRIMDGKWFESLQMRFSEISIKIWNISE